MGDDPYAARRGSAPPLALRLRKVMLSGGVAGNALKSRWRRQLIGPIHRGAGRQVFLL